MGKSGGQERWCKSESDGQETARCGAWRVGHVGRGSWVVGRWARWGNGEEGGVSVLSDELHCTKENRRCDNRSPAVFWYITSLQTAGLLNPPPSLLLPSPPPRCFD
jgi:hypothetical protein